MSLNSELSELFSSLAAMMELKGENTFKVIAFAKVGRIIREVNIDLKRCMEEGKLCDIEGIGKGSRQIIEEYIQTGKSTVYQEIAASVPAGLVPLLSIEGLGPKTIHLLWRERNITGLDELEKAVRSGAIKGLKGIGDKKLQTILSGIELHKSRLADGGSGAVRRIGIGEALEPAQELLERLRAIPGVLQAELAGSLRRRRETIADVDLVAALAPSAVARDIAQAFTQLPGVVQTIGSGQSKTSVKVSNGMQVDLRLVPPEHFGSAMLYFTGSKEHNVKIRGLAQKKSLTLNEWGLYDIAAYEKAPKQTARPPELEPLASQTEAQVYAALGLEYIEPELREDRGEVEAAVVRKLPALITRADIRGDLHNHTTESDGTATIEQMARAAKAMGYEYLAITDHSKALAMTNGLSVDRLIKHVENIHRLNSKLKGITLLAGSEVDILADGRMDYEDAVLKELDIVIASPHLSLKQDGRKATARLLRAIENRCVNIIGHPTGRLINRREGLPLDFPTLFKAAAANGTAMEINSSYPRLDLDEFHARAAIEAGVMLSIDTDAHSTGELDSIFFGIAVARRAWATKDNVLNCQPLTKVKKFLSAKR